MSRTFILKFISRKLPLHLGLMVVGNKTKTQRAFHSRKIRFTKAGQWRKGSSVWQRFLPDTSKQEATLSGGIGGRVCDLKEAGRHFQGTLKCRQYLKARPGLGAAGGGSEVVGRAGICWDKNQKSFSAHL